MIEALGILDIHLRLRWVNVQWEIYMHSNNMFMSCKYV